MWQLAVFYGALILLYNKLRFVVDSDLRCWIMQRFY